MKNIAIGTDGFELDGKKSDQGFTSDQIKAYKAVLEYEANRCGLTENDEARSFFFSKAGGVSGKSALLHRISLGLKPFVAAPPLSFSYPWYDVVEGTGPWEVLIEGDTVHELMAKTYESKAWLPNHDADPQISISQHYWNVIEAIDSKTVLLTHKNWSHLGFIWKLSLDTFPVSESTSTILSWHNPEIKKITKLSELREEQKWHLMRKIEKLALAMDPEKAQSLVTEAQHKDTCNSERVGIHGWISKYEENLVLGEIERARKTVSERILTGKPPLPSEVEIEKMIDDKMNMYLKPSEAHGTRWYSVAEDGETLLLNTWRLHRNTPKEAPDSIYLQIF